MSIFEPQNDAGIEDTNIEGVKVVTPKVFPDDRGSFMESYSLRRYREGGIDCEFVQDNISRSCRGVIRGLHYQLKNSQDKLLQVIEGRVLDVAVDIRKGSPTFGQWIGVELSGENRRQIFIPKGFAHGFSVLSETAIVHYKCSEFYTPGDEYGILFSDPELAIDWQVESPIVSTKDKANSTLSQMNPDHLPDYI